MTNREKYEAVIEGLGELLKEKNEKIGLLEWQLEEAKKELKAAEKYAEAKDRRNRTLEIR